MKYTHILVPLDGSQMAEYILPYVESMASAFDSEVTLLHIIETENPNEDRLTPSLRNARTDIAAYLVSMADKLANHHVRTEWQISTGEPSREIARYAHEKGADLVMMSTHGHTERQKNGLGAVAMEVVASGDTPVMLIRPPEKVARR